MIVTVKFVRQRSVPTGVSRVDKGEECCTCVQATSYTRNVVGLIAYSTARCGF